MIALYLASWGEAAGKTALCLGIARHLQGRGKRVGYFKPLKVGAAPELPAVDPDAEFAGQVLGLRETRDLLCPFTFTREKLQEELKNRDWFGDRLRRAFFTVAAGKEVVVAEGLSGLEADETLAEAARLSSQALQAKVILLARYSAGLPWERLVSLGRGWGQRLLGVVVTAVPENREEGLREKLGALCAAAGIKMLGILPQQRLLLTVSLEELARHLQGEVLGGDGAMEELVENLMLGALSIDCGVLYFDRKPNKVVITRGDRPDLLMAALATSTRGLILTEGVAPTPHVRHWAEEKGVPVVVVRQGTLAVAAAVEEVLRGARFRQRKKLEKLEEVLQQHFDFETLDRELGS
jgi:hypothetical protein